MALQVAAQTEEILGLAMSRSSEDRERLLSAILQLCEGQDTATIKGSAPIQALLNSIFMCLVVEAERDIRRRLAERLAGADWAPAALINVLALDDIEIARPIIASSPVLQDHDLIRLLVEATIEHQIEVARRPRISAAVVAAILQGDEPAVLAALAGNTSAQVGEAAMTQLVDRARGNAALRSAVARHPALTEGMAERLYLWVGQSLRTALLARFRLNAEALDGVLAEAVCDAHVGEFARESGSPVSHHRDQAREDMEQRLVEKLNAAGQLRPGYLLRALRERRLSLFANALATLGCYAPADVYKALESERPELLALACAGVGLDRSVFPTVLTLTRDLNDGRPGGGVEGARKAANAFGPFAPDIARLAFRKAVSAV